MGSATRLREDTRGVFILLPVLNERENIEELLDSIESALPGPHTVCVVDDGSRDGTVEYLEGRLARPGHNLHLIRRVKTTRGSQRGGALHSALLWGLANTEHGVFVEMDGDLSHRPEELCDGIGRIEQGAYDVAIASKFVPGSRVTNRPWSRSVVSRVCSGAVRGLITTKIADYSNGYRFYNRRAAEIIAEHTIRYGSPIYLTEVLALWVRNRLRIVEFPTVYIGRNEGISKLRVTDLFKASIAIFEVSFRFHFAGFKRTGPAQHMAAKAKAGSAVSQQE